MQLPGRNCPYLYGSSKSEKSGSEKGNEITADDLARCDACIIASDVKIKGSSRFKDVPTMNFKVNEPIKNADAVIDELVEALG